MAKAVSQAIKDILKIYEMEPKEALWDCHGTWVMYHKSIELVAAKAGINTTFKQVLHSDGTSVAILVTGDNGDRVEWTVGEAAPKNNKNAYPWAMAEKRAKDRVILKLVGLAGHVYSEDDVADKTSETPFEVDPWDEWKDTAIAGLESCTDEQTRQLWLTMNTKELELCYKESKTNGQLVNQTLQAKKSEFA
jgi:hypothetical protein